MDPFLELFGAVAPFLRDVQEGLPQAPDVPAPPLYQEALPPTHTNVDYDPIEPRIGGESLSQIYLRLICKYKGKGELPPSNIFLDQAYAIFESKRRILLKMNELDPGGGWIANGAQFIKTKKGGDFSLKSLNAIFESLESEGRNGEYWHSFLSKRDGL